MGNHSNSLVAGNHCYIRAKTVEKEKIA